MEFKQIQTRAQPEESLKHNHSCTNLSPECTSNGRVLGLCNYGYVLMIPRAAPSFESGVAKELVSRGHKSRGGNSRGHFHSYLNAYSNSHLN